MTFCCLIFEACFLFINSSDVNLSHVQLAKILSNPVGGLSSLSHPLLCRRFCMSCNPSDQYLVISYAVLVLCRKSLPMTIARYTRFILFRSNFSILELISKSLIHFEIILCSVRDRV